MPALTRGQVVPTLSAALERAIEVVEGAQVLDPVAKALAPVVARLAPTGPIKDALSGTWLGHPLHPVLVTVPIGSWVGATWLDLTGGVLGRDAAQRLIGFGTVAALPTALTGASDWLDTEGAEKRVGLVHAALNYASIGLYAASWLARRRGSQGRGVALALLGATTVGVSGWLGGHLAYAQGVGVDATAYTQFPPEWTDALAADDLAEGRPVPGDAGGVPVLLVRRGDEVTAIADRCTHRGAPLHEGDVQSVAGRACVVCPWHSSAFALDDGSVQRGPATRPQPVLEARVQDGRVQVRRTDQRAVRTNPIGV